MTTAAAQKTVVYTKSGKAVSVWPSTANPVDADEMVRRRDEWYARNKHLLEGYSTEQFIAEKRRDVKAGIE